MPEIEAYKPGPAAQWFVSADDAVVVKKLREAVACDDVAEAKSIIGDLEEGHYKRMILNAGGYEDASADPSAYIRIGYDHTISYLPFDPERNSLIAISRSKEMVELLEASGASIFLSNDRKHQAREYAWETMERLGTPAEAITAAVALHDAKEREIFQQCGANLPQVLEFLNIALGEGNAFGATLKAAQTRALPGPGGTQ